MLWIQATNPAVSMPNLPHIRKILSNPELFVVVQDAFMTETAEFADVVLPCALWGEKSGCFTNVDRTVHISHKAVEPPGEAKSDLDIFLDFSRRMGFRDKDGAPLIKWDTPEEAFEAWKACTRGRPCDYTGLSYEKLSRATEFHGPATRPIPRESTGLTKNSYSRRTPTLETFGHDLITGGLVSPEKYRANNPAGRAILKPADYVPPSESADKQYPYMLTTGRLVHHSILERRLAARPNYRLPQLTKLYKSRRRMPRNCVSRMATGSASLRDAAASRRRQRSEISARTRLPTLPFRILGQPRSSARRERADPL